MLYEQSLTDEEKREINIKIAHSLFGLMDDKQISKHTGLSLDENKRLKHPR